MATTRSSKVREHIGALFDAGMSTVDIARASGCTPHTIYRQGKQNPASVNVDVAEAILAVPPPIMPSPHVMRDADPSRERIRWLHDDHGMTLDGISEVTGVTRTTLSYIRSGKRKQVTYDTHAALMGAAPKNIPPAGSVHADRARAHLMYLYGQGMSVYRMTHLANTHAEVLQGVMFGGTRYIRKTTERGLLAVPYEEPSIRGGRPTDATITRRKLQALVAAGFGIRKVFGGRIEEVANGKRQFICFKTAERVGELYPKLIHADPLDWGSKPAGKLRNIRMAQRRGYAPPGCWDPDTVDDPDALPEWTGGPCGTTAGFRIHKRDGIPVCPPCQQAKNEEVRTHNPHKSNLTGVEVVKIKPHVLTEVRTAISMSKDGLSREAGLSSDTVMMWENSKRDPSVYRFEQLVGALERLAPWFDTDSLRRSDDE